MVDLYMGSNRGQTHLISSVMIAFVDVTGTPSLLETLQGNRLRKRSWVPTSIEDILSLAIGFPFNGMAATTVTDLDVELFSLS